MSEILTVTINPAIDKTTTVQSVVPEDKLRCAVPTYEAGGGGINVSRVIKRFGVDTICLFTAAGKRGQIVQELLEKEKVKCVPVHVGGSTRENLTVFEESTENQFRFNMPGCPINKDDLGKVLLAIEKITPAPKYLVISGSIPNGTSEDIYSRIIKLFKDKKTKVILDTSGTPFQLAVEEGVFLVKPNKKELALLFDKDANDFQALEDCSKELISSGKSEVVVLSMGKEGVLVVTKEESKVIKAPDVKVRSAVGAGDSMVAGIVYSLSIGRKLEEAVAYGIASGSAAVMTPGTELCNKEDVENLYNKMITKA